MIGPKWRDLNCLSLYAVQFCMLMVVGKGGLETLGILKAILLLCSGDALR